MENKTNIAELLKDCPKGMELDCTMFDNVYFEQINENVDYPIRIKIGEIDSINLTKCGCWDKHSNAKCIIFPKGKTTWEGFVPPCKFKDGDVIFVESTYDWILIYKEDEDEKYLYKYVAIPCHCDSNFITYRSNPVCCKEEVSEIRFTTEEEKQKLFDAIKANGYKWNAKTKTLEKLVEVRFKVGDRIKDVRNNSKGIILKINNDSYECRFDFGNFLVDFKEQGYFELVSNKFDINTLKPFDKVLGRNANTLKWTNSFYSKYDVKDNYPFHCIYFGRFKQCIPYEGNEHLLNTTNDCDEYYKTWE